MNTIRTLAALTLSLGLIGAAYAADTLTPAVAKAPAVTVTPSATPSATPTATPTDKPAKLVKKAAHKTHKVSKANDRQPYASTGCHPCRQISDAGRSKRKMRRWRFFRL